MDGAGHELGLGQRPERLPDGERDLDGGQQARCSVHRRHLLSADQPGLHRAGSDEEQSADDAVLAGPESRVPQAGRRSDGADLRARHHLGTGGYGTHSLFTLMISIMFCVHLIETIAVEFNC